MQERQQVFPTPNLTIGVDLGDRRSRVYVVDAAGEQLEERWVQTTVSDWVGYLRQKPAARVVMEVGTHSPWMSREAEALGHEVIVANPSEMQGRRGRRRRNDKLDAEKLARLGRADPKLLHPIRHRGEAAQVDLALLKSRDTLVQARSKLIGHARGIVKALGERLPACQAEAFARRASEVLPESLRPALEPVLEQIQSLTDCIRRMDRQIETRTEEAYPETERLRQVKGVGPLTGLAYVLVLEDPTRFPRSREVGSFIGLVPKLDESGASSPQLRITKAGDELLRKLLVQAAHYILGPFGPDTDLRRWGLALMTRGGKNAKKRAVVAVARKLAVLLHRLWQTGSVYVPLREELHRILEAAQGEPAPARVPVLHEPADLRAHADLARDAGRGGRRRRAR
jgi:transposase